MTNKKPFSSVPLKNTLDFSVIKADVDTLLTATIARIQTQLPESLQRINGLQEILELSIRASENSYHTIRYVCADKPDDPARKPEYSLALAPILRSLADQVFNLSYLAEDLSGRTQEYLNAGWKESQEALALHKSRFGTNPDHAEWIKESEELLDTTRTLWAIPDSVANSDKWARWPTPGITRGGNAGREHLYLWFYKALSQHSHSSWHGLIKHSAPLLKLPGEQHTKDMREVVLKRKSDTVFTALTLILCILTEIEGICAFGSKAKLAYLWTIVGEYWPEAKELYGLRYSVMVGNPT